MKLPVNTHTRQRHSRRVSNRPPPGGGGVADTLQACSCRNGTVVITRRLHGTCCNSSSRHKPPQQPAESKAHTTQENLPQQHTDRMLCVRSRAYTMTGSKGGADGACMVTIAHQQHTYMKPLLFTRTERRVRRRMDVAVEGRRSGSVWQNTASGHDALTPPCSHRPYSCVPAQSCCLLFGHHCIFCILPGAVYCSDWPCCYCLAFDARQCLHQQLLGRLRVAVVVYGAGTWPLL